MIKSVFKEFGNGSYSKGHCVGTYYNFEHKDIKCTRIILHEPVGPGDRCYCDCYYSDGMIYRIYDPDMIDRDGAI